MSEYTPQEVETIVKNELNQSLEALLREGPRKMLQAALEMEVDHYVFQCQAKRDQNGHRQVVKNGHHPRRELATGVGKIPIRQPRVDDRDSGQRFTSAILPKYMRRLPSIDQLIPALYLKGLILPRKSEQIMKRVLPLHGHMELIPQSSCRAYP